MEQSFVAWAQLRSRKLPAVKLGIGDDAAVLEASGDSVVTTDSLMEGTHFILTETTPHAVGRKVVNANISDLAAMAAEPKAVFLSLCLPENYPGGNDRLAADIFEGVCEACESQGVALAGGDTNCWNGPLVVNLTAVGNPVDDVVWKRSGALPDDLIVVSGPLGGSILGKHLDFQPRMDWVRKVRGNVDIHAAMDITDGLSVDLLRMCDASHVGAILELDRVPSTAAAEELAKQTGETATAHALGDGEDFELLVTLAPKELGKLQEIVGEDQAIVCGTVTSRTGLWAKDGGKIRQMWSTGFVHGAEGRDH